jgi:hypothetical protein
MTAPAASQWANSMVSGRNLDIAQEVGKVAAALDTTPTAVAWPGCAAGPG